MKKQIRVINPYDVDVNDTTQDIYSVFVQRGDFFAKENLLYIVDGFVEAEILFRRFTEMRFKIVSLQVRRGGGTVGEQTLIRASEKGKIVKENLEEVPKWFSERAFGLEEKIKEG